MSLEFAKSFNFLQQDTVIHRLDPRSKGLMVLTFAILAISAKHLASIGILAAIALLPILILSRMISQLLKGLAGLSVLIFSILILNSYLISFNYALVVILRLIVLMGVFSIFFQSTLPEDLTQAMIRFRIPYSMAFATSLSFRFIPTMARETEIIIDAQRSRGHKIEQGGMISQIRNLFPLLIPLLMNSIRRAFHVAEALETRAFGVNKHPTYYFPLKFTKSDWIVTIFSLGLLILGVLFSTNVLILPPWMEWDLPL
ncbi:MAG: energy-coupling factor transporter transmembrane protein EcfT [Candidatus Heimdallarchaeota archaeon]|nr:energy-coupling factor transporter transmembrane protein EcfT [Candidatus Heimdallarchaeota archaeon]